MRELFADDAERFEKFHLTFGDLLRDKIGGGNFEK